MRAAAPSGLNLAIIRGLDGSVSRFGISARLGSSRFARLIGTARLGVKF